MLFRSQQKPPSAVVVPGLLDGVASVKRLVQKWLREGRADRAKLRAGGRA